MTQIIPLSMITAARIEGGKLTNLLPEFYELQSQIEISSWHDNQSVFDHSVKSRIALDEITQFNYLPTETATKLTAYLDETIDLHTRSELLEIATLLHDIGKIISLQHTSNGNTASPSHGVLGSWVAKPLLDRIDLSDRELDHVSSLISDHLVPSDLIEMSINNKNGTNQIVSLLKSHRPDSAVELLLLAYADWIGCDIVDQNILGERDQRITIAHTCLLQLAR